MKIQNIKLDQLNPAKYNLRKKLKPGDPEFEKLKRSIETFGFVELIVVNRQTGDTVISGHQRLGVLKYLNWKEVECVIVDLDPESEKALNVVMNKVGGEFDIPLLTDLLKDLDMSGFDVSLTGFDSAELSDLLENRKPKKMILIHRKHWMKLPSLSQRKGTSGYLVNIDWYAETVPV